MATTVYGATVYGVRGTYDDCSRLVGRARRRGRVGVRERQPALVLRRGLEDARVRDRRAARLGDARRGRRADRLRRDVHEDRPGLRAVPARSGSSTATMPRLFGGQAEGCAPVATAFAEDRRGDPRAPGDRRASIAIGNPADGDLAVETARASGGAIYAVAEDEVGANMALLAETRGVFGETAAGVAIGALRAARRGGEVGATDRVVLLVTGNGLKTPRLGRGERWSGRDRGGRRRAARAARGARVTLVTVLGRRCASEARERRAGHAGSNAPAIHHQVPRAPHPAAERRRRLAESPAPPGIRRGRREA